MIAANYSSSPVDKIFGEITVPGDKSISHRSIILGSIAQGTTIVNGFLEGEDCRATISAFQGMGVKISSLGNNQVIIQGVGKFGLEQSEKTIDCGNSGTTIRLLTGLLAAQSFNSELTGDSSLLKRPMERVRSPLVLMGANVFTHNGNPPIKIQGKSSLIGIDYPMSVASAQVKSCILLAGLYAQGETIIAEPSVSRDHTERMLKAFSYPVYQQNNRVKIEGNSECQACELEIPGDISSAAFFIVAATLVPNSELYLSKVGVNPTRTGILHILRDMGADITILNERLLGQEPVADLLIRSAPLKGVAIAPELVPLAIDEFPILFVAAACAEGKTILRGAKELRLKESDRIGAMVTGLTQLGISALDLEDGVIIHGGQLTGGVVRSFHDHRIAMAFMIAGAVAKEPVVIQDCQNISTSFPDFFKLANTINMNTQEYHESL
jgi:3-phosphoshikimate 1-carboxyvinyltransferase